MVVFGQNDSIWAKLVVVGQSGRNQTKWLYSGKVVVFGQTLFYADKLVVIWQNWFYFGIQLVDGESWL